jgi:anti-anti-sigma factor
MRVATKPLFSDPFARRPFDTDGVTVMVQTVHGWEFDVERGPDWLFIRPHRPSTDLAEAGTLAEEIWSILEQGFANRLVLELDGIGHLRTAVIGQLVRLYKRIHTRGGLMRVCGLSADNRDVLRHCRLDSWLPQYANRSDAVMGIVSAPWQ